MVQSTGPQSAKLRSLRNGEKLTMANTGLRDVKVIGTRSDVLDAVVLTEGRRELQLLHPKTYKPVEIRKPQGFERTGDTVKVFPYEGELYLIGN